MAMPHRKNKLTPNVEKRGRLIGLIDYINGGSPGGPSPYGHVVTEKKGEKKGRKRGRKKKKEEKKENNHRGL